MHCGEISCGVDVDAVDVDVDVDIDVDADAAAAACIHDTAVGSVESSPLAFLVNVSSTAAPSSSHTACFLVVLDMAQRERERESWSIAHVCEVALTA